MKRIIFIICIIFTVSLVACVNTDNSKNQKDNSDTATEEYDIATKEYIKQLSNKKIEEIMGWDFYKNDSIHLVCSDFEDREDSIGYFSKDGKNFINLDENGKELINNHVKISYTPELNGTVKAYSSFGALHSILLLVTSGGELYIGKLDDPVGDNEDFVVNINFYKYETNKKAVGLDLNVIKYKDGSFGFMDYMDLSILAKVTALNYKDIFKIEELKVTNLTDEIVYRLLNGSYKVESIKDASGNVCELKDCNISKVNYLICGSLSVNGFGVSTLEGLLLEYVDLYGNKVREYACVDYIYLDDVTIPANADVNIYRNRIEIVNESLFEKIEYCFELDRKNNIKGKKLSLYMKNGYVINAKYDGTVEELKANFESPENGRYLGLIEKDFLRMHYPYLDNN